MKTYPPPPSPTPQRTCRHHYHALKRQTPHPLWFSSKKEGRSTSRGLPFEEVCTFYLPCVMRKCGIRSHFKKGRRLATRTQCQVVTSSGTKGGMEEVLQSGDGNLQPKRRDMDTTRGGTRPDPHWKLKFPSSPSFYFSKPPPTIGCARLHTSQEQKIRRHFLLSSLAPNTPFHHLLALR